MTAENKPAVAPQAIVPHLICKGAMDAIEFYKKAFGAVEQMCLPGKDGRLMHGCISIGNACVFLVDEMPEWGALSPKSLNGSPVTIHLNVPDADAFVARAVAAGATVTLPVGDAFWGDRYGKIVDPFGHHWSIATHVKDMSLDEIKAAAAKFC